MTTDQKNACEGELTENECLQALKSMENSKSPGDDGIPVEFYKMFWKDIAKFYVNAINNAYKTGKLSTSERRGIIKLIPKKNFITHYVKNWRPITPLNCDYKIASKAIANRLKAVLPSINNNDQTGFLKGRSISENIRLIEGILRYTEAEKVPGLLLFIDLEKAFDTLEWSFVEKVFEYNNFGPSYIEWIKIFYNDIQSSVYNNGWSSGFFNLERGVRQGCPLSPYIFILFAEVLANAIRKNTKIKGIKINEKECKISQYADDTAIFLDGSKNALQESLETLDSFGKISGLKINNFKTEVLWIGTLSKNTNILLPERNLKWATGSVKALGVHFAANEEISMKLNTEEKLDKIKKLVENLGLRKLTIFGKISIITESTASATACLHFNALANLPKDAKRSQCAPF